VETLKTCPEGRRLNMRGQDMSREIAFTSRMIFIGQIGAGINIDI
jgi:hypothetical protein